MKGLVLPLVFLAAVAPAGLRLLEKGHPRVEEGLDAYGRGDYEGALRAFDDAKSELPRNPVVELDRGAALYKLGRLEEAKSAFQRAGELDDGQLRSQDLYDLGTTLAHLGKREEAIKALRRALVKDPGNAAARHNLEVLLRNLAPPSAPGDGGTDGGRDGGEAPDSGTPDGGKPDSGDDGGQDAGPNDGGEDGGASDAGADGGQDGGRGGDGGQNDAGQQGESPSDGGQDGGQDAGPQGPEGNDGGSDAGAGKDGGAPKLKDFDALDAGTGEAPSLPELERDDVERMLDAVRQNERNLQLWKFQQRKRQRKPNEKDW